MWQRLKPAFALLLLAPLISEYLLGSLSFWQLGLFPIMVPIYGGGALLVRELARRSGRGWPTILALGLAYGVIEEGLATQSLFNPHYMGLHLARYGFVPALGIGLPWTTYVILLHAIWSIAVPIGFVEMLFPAQRAIPWLQRTGLTVAGILYVLGVALIALGSWRKEQFAASTTQLTVAALVAIGLAGGAFLFFPRSQRETVGPLESPPWPPLKWGGVALVCGSAFHLLMQFGQAFLPPAVAVGVLIFAPLALLMRVGKACRSNGWSLQHTDAMVLGGLLVYCWLGFLLAARLHGPGAAVGQFFPCLIVLGLVWRRRQKLRIKR